MMSLPPADLAKLVKVCGLFGSDHDGERASAAHKAQKIIEKHKLTWADVLSPAALPHPESKPAAPIRAHVAGAAWVLGADRAAGVLTAWERDFLVNLGAFKKVSAKQSDVLARLVQKVTRATEAQHEGL